MGFLSNLFGSGKPGADSPAKTHTLIAIDWDRISKYVDDLSFLGEYPNAVIWVYVNNRSDKTKISKLLNNRPFSSKEQPAYERRMPMYMLFSLAHELYTNARYKRVVVVAGDDSLTGAVTHWKSIGLEADIKVFDPSGGRVTGRDDRREDRRDDRRNTREERTTRNDRQTRPEREERTPRNNRPEREERNNRPERPERKPKPERVESQTPAPQETDKPARPPRPDVIPENDFFKDHPEAVADQVANAFRHHFALGQHYTISRMAQVVKEATGTSITTLFGHRGNRIMLDRLLEENLLATEDQKNFLVQGHPEASLILHLIQNRQEENPERGRFNGKRNFRHNKNRRGENRNERQTPEAPIVHN